MNADVKPSEPLEESAVRTPSQFIRHSEMATAVCGNEVCKKKFEYLVLHIAGIDDANLIPKLCDDCQVASDRAAVIHPSRRDSRHEARARHEEIWKEMCPVKYRTVEEGGLTDVKLLPADKLARMLRWTPKLRPRGLAIHGETRKCKTRCLWRLLRKLYDDGLNIVYFDSNSFAHECSAAFRDGGEKAWLSKMKNADIVAFDDLWKMPMTERVDAEFFGMIEYLGAWDIPYFFTTNFVGDDMIALAKKPNSKYSVDRIVALVARMRQDCQTISFI